MEPVETEQEVEDPFKRIFFWVSTDPDTGSKDFFQLAMNKKVFELDPMTFHRALRNEVEGALRDMIPLITERCYRIWGKDI